MSKLILRITVKGETYKIYEVKYFLFFKYYKSLLKTNNQKEFYEALEFLKNSTEDD